jgi:hypothetical protein
MKRTAPAPGARIGVPLVVLTGGPGAGKTAVLEVVEQHFCRHLGVLPESAGIVYGGGFPRAELGPARRAGQRAIFHVQRELERMIEEDRRVVAALCDRGTIDGIAYWPDDPATFWAEVGTTRSAELRRYAAVIHLRTPAAGRGYNRRNPLRIETAREAADIDERIAAAWNGHPRRFFVDSTRHFMDKVEKAIAVLEREVPELSTCRLAHRDSDERPGWRRSIAVAR